MTKDEKKPKESQVAKTQEELEDEEDMKRAGLMNPPDACGREEDKFSN